MPKKRSLRPGYTKKIQRILRRAASGPSLPTAKTKETQPRPAFSATDANSPNGDHDVSVNGHWEGATVVIDEASIKRPDVR